MDFIKAKDVIRNGYIDAGFTITDEGRELSISSDDLPYLVLEEDIERYAELYPQFDSLKVAPCECAICSNDYREQVVIPIESVPLGSVMYRLRDCTVFGKEAESTYVEIGPSSEIFVNRLRFSEGFMEMSKIRMRSSHVRRQRYNREKEKILDIRETLYQPITARVHNIGASSVEAAIRISTPIIEACLFELSYLKELPLGLSHEWPRRQSRTRPFRIRDIERGDHLPLPTVQFNADIVRFYQRGVSTRDPVIQFLSFYQVLEYFFLSVSDGKLYDTLSHRLNDPAFKAVPRNLDRLIQDVLDHRRITDETEMLKLVLQNYVESDELVDFIEDYEIYLGEKHYTKRRQMFGQDMPEVRFEEQHLWGNIAKRIKVIRNAIVHSSDRHERSERYVPLTTRAEDAIMKEIPLMKFLAERVVIATANG